MTMFDSVKGFAAKLLGLSQRVETLDKTVLDLERKLERTTSLLNQCVIELKTQKANRKTELDSLRRELEHSRELTTMQFQKDIQSSAYSIRDHLEQRFDKRVQCLEDRLSHPHRLHTPSIPQIPSDDNAVVSRIAAGQ